MKVTGAAALAAATVLTSTVVAAAPGSAAAPQPNLVVTAVTWAPTAPVAGQQVRFTATIENRGNAATPAGVVHGVGFQVDGVLRTWSDDFRGTLQPGQRTTLSAVGGPAGATWPAVAGPRTVRAHVDDAKRIAESNEGDNVLDRRLDVAPGLSLRVRGGDVVTTVAANSRATVTATSMTGGVYGGCFTAGGTLVDGSERYLQEFTVGNDTFSPGAGSFGYVGLAEVPASRTATALRTELGFGQLLRSYQGHFPFTCAAGSAPGFSRFQARSVRTTQWYGSMGGGAGAQVATATAAVDVDLDVAI